MRSLLLIAAAGLAAGCATDPFKSVDASLATSAVELENTAFFAQDAYQCGPAALATLLASTGISVAPADLVPMVFVPDRRGSLQAEIVSASRTFGRLPYEIDPDFTALLQELHAGRPVLVLQNLGIALAPAWHYAVVIGYSGEHREVILRSGRTRRHVMSARTFVNTWRRSDSWAIVLLQPGIIPPTVNADRYLRAAAAAESAGQLELALSAYTAAAQRWPDEALPRLGIGNVHYAKGDLAAAEDWYRRYLKLAPDDPLGTNNLATVLAERGSCTEAMGLVAHALDAQQEDSPYRALLTTTRAELDDCGSVDE